MIMFALYNTKAPALFNVKKQRGYYRIQILNFYIIWMNNKRASNMLTTEISPQFVSDRLIINDDGEYSLNLESPEVRADVMKQIRKFKDFPTEN